MCTAPNHRDRWVPEDVRAHYSGALGWNSTNATSGNNQFVSPFQGFDRFNLLPRAALRPLGADSALPWADMFGALRADLSLSIRPDWGSSIRPEWGSNKSASAIGRQRTLFCTSIRPARPDRVIRAARRTCGHTTIRNPLRRCPAGQPQISERHWASGARCYAQEFAPKGQQQISPGQSDVRSRRTERRPG